jgi:hypothetical protein
VDLSHWLSTLYLSANLQNNKYVKGEYGEGRGKALFLCRDILWNMENLMPELTLKVHKNENFFGSNFEFFYFFIVSYAEILGFCKQNFLIGPKLREI